MRDTGEFDVNNFDDFIGLYASPFAPIPESGYTIENMRHSFEEGQRVEHDRVCVYIKYRNVPIYDSGCGISLMRSQLLSFCPHCGGKIQVQESEA